MYSLGLTLSATRSTHAYSVVGGSGNCGVSVPVAAVIT